MDWTIYKDDGEFLSKLEEVCEVESGELSDKAMSIAYELGHAYGHNEIANHYMDLADLVIMAQKQIKENK